MELKGGRKGHNYPPSVIKITEEGIELIETAVLNTPQGIVFRSYRNGDKILLSPESSVWAQKVFKICELFSRNQKLGSDIILPLDILNPYNITPEKLLESLERTHRWEARSLAAHLEDPKQQAMYSIIHGGVDFELRERSIAYLSR